MATPAPLEYAPPPPSRSTRRGPQYALALAANLCGLTFAAYVTVASTTSPWGWLGVPAWLVAVAGSLLQMALTVWAATVFVELSRVSWRDPLIWVACLATAGYLIALPVTLVASR